VAAVQALVEGSVDLAAATLDAALRFGPRQGEHPFRLVFGLTAAPPVALLAWRGAEPAIRSVEDLAGRRVGVPAPGAPERAWLQALLEWPGGVSIQVDPLSVGTRGAAAALERGEVEAALVPEPDATDLLESGRALLLADWRDRDAADRALGKPTVNAAVLASVPRVPAPATLAAFHRALARAVLRIEVAGPEALARRLPAAVVGSADRFRRRLETTTRIYLPEGAVSAERLLSSIALIRAHHPLPPALRIPPPAAMVLGPAAGAPR
jgi:NitT/TauT family transport system substrate-binding protein